MAGVAFQEERRLACTLAVFWDKGCAEPWLILTDLAPHDCEAGWYRLRGWIEHGFKLTKREGWQWQRSRIQEAARANRMWLVLAVATLWLLTQGTSQEAADPEYKPAAPRQISVFRRGWVSQVVALWQGQPLEWRPSLRLQSWPLPPQNYVFCDSS